MHRKSHRNSVGGRTGFLRASWLLAVGLLLAGRTSAQTWNEQGDAPPTMPGQVTQGSGPLLVIHGTIAPGGDVDLYGICIDDPVGFSATTLGGAAFDTQLFLFDAGGCGVAHDDDMAGSAQSKLTGQLVPGPGVYALGISAWDRDARGVAGNEIWNDLPRNLERPPDGPGAPGPLQGWSGVAHGQGTYAIQLTGASFSSQGGTPPEIVVHPAWTPAKVGSNAQLSVVATGEPLTYQWYHAGTVLRGATSDVLVRPEVGAGDGGPHYVVVTNPWGSVVSKSAELAVYQDVPPIAEPGCYVPEVWQQDPVPWVRDQSPRNKIDDLIDTAPPTVRHDIIIDFRACVTQEHLDWLENMCAESYVEWNFQAISAVAVANVSYESAREIAKSDDVALIEDQILYRAALDTSLQTIRVTSGFYSLDTVQDQFGTTGAGVNIAILDSGVDDPGGPGTTHAGLPEADWSYDSVNETSTTVPTAFSNPDDDHYVGHGTHVASIVLGRDELVGPGPRGVAPGANLIDVKVLDAAGEGTAEIVMRGLDVVLTQGWSARIANMSFNGTAASDGNDALPQLVDRAVDLGIVVVCSAGDVPPPALPGSIATAPGVAARAITVAASNDMASPDRGDDAIADFSAVGPVPDDGDPDESDAIKPDVAAPGVAIEAAASETPDGRRELSGTSQAAAHVSGVAALLIQTRPDINAGSVKQGIIRGASGVGWDAASGWGLIDAYASVDLALCQANVRFVEPESPNPWDPWEGPAIAVDPDPPFAGEPNVATVTVRNDGPGTARGVRLDLGVYHFTSAGPTFTHLGTRILPDLAPGEQISVDFDWTPVRGSQCLKAELENACDTNFLDNKVQRNIYETRSPAWFEARNEVFDGPLTIDFVRLNENPDWGLTITPPSVTLSPGDPPVVIEALPIPAAGTPEGASEVIRIAAVANGEIIGGVSIRAIMRDCNGNGIEDWFDIRDGTSTDCEVASRDRTALVSRGAGNVLGNDTTLGPVSLSADARWVVFDSLASNLVPGDANGAMDVFLRDRDSDADGFFDEPGSVATVLVSRSISGASGNGESGHDLGAPGGAQISGDGRFVVFESLASDLVPGDSNGTKDVFLRDLVAGTMVRIGPAGGAEPNGASQAPAISPDGRHVSFASFATNLAAGSNGLRQIYVWDRLTGSLACASKSTTGTLGNGASNNPQIAANGTSVVFESLASNLVASDTNGSMDVFLADRDADCDGILDEPGSVATQRVSVSSSGAQASGDHAVMSHDGRWIAFRSASNQLVAGDTNGKLDVFVRDVAGGITTRASITSSGGQVNSDSVLPAISHDGRYVAFSGLAAAFAPDDANNAFDVFVHDRASAQTLLVSRSNTGSVSSSDSAFAAFSVEPVALAFQSVAADLVLGDVNATGDSFVRMFRDCDDDGAIDAFQGLVECGNGLPDECEPDCNGNGTADSCDIAAGISFDKNGNGRPDECEFVRLPNADGKVFQ